MAGRAVRRTEVRDTPVEVYNKSFWLVYPHLGILVGHTKKGLNDILNRSTVT